jgi:UDP-N-acetyl-D-glucosamine dehydrogenase
MIPKPPGSRYEVAIVGLGYVGIPLAIAFAEGGCRTLGFDVNKDRVRLLKGGDSPLVHLPGEKISATLEKHDLSFTHDRKLLAESEAIVICVPTPLRSHLDPDLDYILEAGREIAPYLRRGTLVSLESSTYPGTTREDLRRVLEEISGLEAGVDFALAFSPEREDPGNAQSVLNEMPKVVGGFSRDCLRRAKELYSRAVKKVICVSSTDTAEAVKLTENIFRFINIALVNELKRIYEPMKIDIWEVVDAASTKPFGFMPFYPGIGVGGHCIPIDPYYLTWKAREFGLETRFIDLAGQINRSMPRYVVAHVVEALNALSLPVQNSSVLVVGVAYKGNVSDDRESPAYRVMDLLHQQGAIVDYYDPWVPEVGSHCDSNLWIGHRSIEWTQRNLIQYHAAVVCTPHKDVDYTQLATYVPLIVDACHIVPRDRSARVIAT